MSRASGQEPQGEPWQEPGGQVEPPVASRVLDISDVESDEESPMLRHVDLFNTPLGMQYALKSACKSFALFYFLRIGVAYLINLFTLLRLRPRALLRMTLTNDLDGLILPVSRAMPMSVRWGQMAGSFTLIFHTIRKLVNDRCDDDQLATFLGGCMGGFSLLFWDRASFRTLSLYLFARALRAVWKVLKDRGVVSRYLGLTDESHLVRWGNSHLFALATGQIMYSYVMHPSSLGESYWKFIVRMGPVSAPVLTAIKQLNTRGPAGIDIDGLRAGLALPESANFIADSLIIRDVLGAAAEQFPDRPLKLPPGQPTRLLPLLAQVTLRSAGQALPIYLGLQAIPSLLLRLKALFRSPVKVLVTYFKNALLSTAFMGCFPTVYVMLPLLAQAIFPPRKPWTRNAAQYWVAGWLASFTLLFERESRQGELTVYALSMGMNCLWNLADIQGRLRFLRLLPAGLGELLIYSLSMGILSYFHHYERDDVKSMFGTVYARMIRSHNQKIILQPGQELPTHNHDQSTCKLLKDVACSCSSSDGKLDKASPSKVLYAKQYVSIARRRSYEQALSSTASS